MTEISKEWCINMAKQEGDSDIAAGLLARDPDTQDVSSIDFQQRIGIAGELALRLDGLQVWPRSIADSHADILTDRQVAMLYDASEAMNEAAASLRQPTEIQVNELTFYARELLVQCDEIARTHGWPNNMQRDDLRRALTDMEREHD